ncbi:ABC transporter permease [Ectopseudomonas oleovorans]|uniref:ABC transporter permease n=1 Tax=Ectopseudomonas oleovorans TaxID=301 RepID=UPI000CF0B867|nr:ABC transporter permease [Pseudomonas oleovorans]PPV34368.1 ABC transporter [Pseudomonas oleovorans]
MLATARLLWAYRDFILGSAKREFQAKYRNSLLGATWTIIQPLAMITIYTVIFSKLMHARLPGSNSTFAYSIYLCAGVITWGFFAEITSRSQAIFIENANLLKKINFPRLCLPLTLILSASLNFAIIFSLFVIFLLITNQFPGWVFLAVLPVLAVQALFATGLGMTLGVLNVFFRDIGQLFSVILQFWFWLTPIIYPVDILPGSLQQLMQFNPMAAVIGAYQRILVSGLWPDWSTLWLPLALGLALSWWGLKLFRQNAGELVDEL